MWVNRRTHPHVIEVYSCEQLIEETSHSILSVVSVSASDSEMYSIFSRGAMTNQKFLFFHAPEHCSDVEVYVKSLSRRDQKLVYKGEPSLAQFLSFLEYAQYPTVIKYNEQTRFLLQQHLKPVIVLFSDSLSESFVEAASGASDDFLAIYCPFETRLQKTLAINLGVES